MEHRTARVQGIRLQTNVFTPEDIAVYVTPLDIWRELADDVRGEGIPEWGSFLAEEQPQAVAAKLLQFLG
jgi:hypothetical protein